MASEEMFGSESSNMLSFASLPKIDSRGCSITVPKNGLTALPVDAFLLVVSFLDPRDLVRSRTVCKDWNLAFSNPEILYPSLKLFFPHSREVRQLTQQVRSNGSLSSRSIVAIDWTAIFKELAARYFSLRRGRARTVQKLKQYNRDEDTYYYPVKAWDEHESFGAQYQAWLYDHTFWSYDDGLLAFASEEDRAIIVLDVLSQQKAIVPFLMSSRVIRNIRLKQRVLVIEWAEIRPFHWLNELEAVHRHFASCFDIVTADSGTDGDCWQASFRNEWKMHFLGLPLSDRDRFFSTHISNYYVIYFWGQNRSLYTGQEIESLAVWDISHSSKYLPSADASGKHAPEDFSVHGPHAIHRYNFNDLNFFGILQGASPSMMSFRIDDEANNIYWIENEYVRPTNASNLGRNQWRSRVTTIPLTPGPVNRVLGEMSLPTYAGSCSFESIHQRYPQDDTYLGVMDVFDMNSDVLYSVLRTNISGPFNWTGVKIRVRGEATVDLSEELTELITYKGKVAGDERLLIGESSRQEIVILNF